jgi:hypothetical protein
MVSLCPANWWKNVYCALAPRARSVVVMFLGGAASPHEQCRGCELASCNHHHVWQTRPPVSLQIVVGSPRSREQQHLPRRLRRFRTGNQSMLVNREFLKGQSCRRWLSSRSTGATRFSTRPTPSCLHSPPSFPTELVVPILLSS